MSDAIIGAVIGVGFLTVVNVVTVAFLFGKLNQKVDDLCRRVSRLEAVTDKVQHMEVER